MIILNTTFYIHPSIESEFLLWIKKEYVPAALVARLEEPQLAVILTEVGEDVTGYAFQLKASCKQEAEAWHDGEGASLRDRFIGRYGQKAIFFSTYMGLLPLE